MISVLTVSKRNGWEWGARQQLDAQTYGDIEWIVVTEMAYSDSALQSGDFVVTHLMAPPKTRVSNLNASLNKGLKACRGEFVVFYQDFIELPPDCLERLLQDAEQTHGFVTTATINPDGQMDGRYMGLDMLRPCLPEEYETNVAIARMSVIKELGGFDEEYDDGWSWDNVNLAERAALLGVEFYIDESINPQLLYHPKEPELNPELRLNGEFHAQKMRAIRQGQGGLRLDYL